MATNVHLKTPNHTPIFIISNIPAAAGLVTEVAAENKVTHQKDEAASVKTPIVPVRVCVVGAAQPLAYSLVPLFFDSCFTDVPLAIVLHDAKEHTGTLEGRKIFMFYMLYEVVILIKSFYRGYMINKLYSCSLIG